MLRPFGAEIWRVVGPALRMPGGVMMPLASTILRLADRSLLVYSPIAFTDEQAAAIAGEGEVRHIVAPNPLHHLHVRAAAERWPHAAVLGVPGLAAKRPDVTFARELASGALDPAVEVEIIGGAPKLNEGVLFHRPSGTLVCADFLFNVTEPANLRTRFVLSVMGTGGRELKQSRLWKSLVRDRTATRASIERVLGWPITTVAPTHGEPATINAAMLAPKLARSYGGPVSAATTA